ncbi:MAG: outer rane immunogenic protein [Sphingomonadales bacterium]|nr:outer rane immunogenic protein [Sphingomonadales bacterium]
MKARLLIAALAAAVSTHGAWAQEPTPQRAARHSATSGFRIEALAGYDTDGYEDGTLYGGRVGYDFRLGNHFLLGLDGEYSDVTTRQHFAFPGSPSLTADDGPEIYAGGRATFVLSSHFRLYGGAGYSHIKEGYFFLSSPNPAPLGTVAAGRRSYDGFRLSAGGQVMLGRRAFLGAEYRRAGYEDYGLSREQVVGSVGFRF